MQNNGKGKDPRFKDLNGEQLYNAILKDFKRQVSTPARKHSRSYLNSWEEKTITKKF